MGIPISYIIIIIIIVKRKYVDNIILHGINAFLFYFIWIVREVRLAMTIILFVLFKWFYTECDE